MLYLYVICLIVDEWLGSNFEGQCIVLQYKLTFGSLAPRCCAAFLPHTPKKMKRSCKRLDHREREEKEKRKETFLHFQFNFFSKLQQRQQSAAVCNQQQQHAAANTTNTVKSKCPFSQKRKIMVHYNYIYLNTYLLDY